MSNQRRGKLCTSLERALDAAVSNIVILLMIKVLHDSML